MTIDTKALRAKAIEWRDSPNAMTTEGLFRWRQDAHPEKVLALLDEVERLQVAIEEASNDNRWPVKLPDSECSKVATSGWIAELDKALFDDTLTGPEVDIVRTLLGALKHERKQIDATKVTGETSDGYHTFNELYDHRISLFIAFASLVEEYVDDRYAWRSRLHSDGTSFDGWFIAGVGHRPGEQLTYHLPMSRWADTDWMMEIERAPEFDGHTSADVLKRLRGYWPGPRIDPAIDSDQPQPTPAVFTSMEDLDDVDF